MTIEQAEKTLSDYCLQTLTKAGREWLTEAVREQANGLNQDAQARIVNQLMDSVEGYIAHHADKVMARRNCVPTQE